MWWRRSKRELPTTLRLNSLPRERQQAETLKSPLVAGLAPERRMATQRPLIMTAPPTRKQLRTHNPLIEKPRLGHPRANGRLTNRQRMRQPRMSPLLNIRRRRVRRARLIPLLAPSRPRMKARHDQLPGRRAVRMRQAHRTRHLEARLRLINLRRLTSQHQRTRQLRRMKLRQPTKLLRLTKLLLHIRPLLRIRPLRRIKLLRPNRLLHVRRRKVLAANNLLS
jgi:hypothetical protein